MLRARCRVSALQAKVITVLGVLEKWLQCCQHLPLQLWIKAALIFIRMIVKTNKVKTLSPQPNKTSDRANADDHPRQSNKCPPDEDEPSQWPAKKNQNCPCLTDKNSKSSLQRTNIAPQMHYRRYRSPHPEKNSQAKSKKLNDYRLIQ